MSVLCDLVRHQYVLSYHHGKLYVAPVTLEAWSGRVEDHKALQRSLLIQKRTEQLKEPTVARFIRSVEEHRERHGKRSSISALIGSPQALRQTMEKFLRGELDDAPIDPVLQPAVAGAVDEFTGLALQDIWRYMRHTWTLPYNSTPGRTMQYLVRDRAQPNWPIIGILGLGSALVQISARDDAIGWTTKVLTQRIQAGLPPEEAQRVFDSLQGALRRTIQETNRHRLLDLRGGLSLAKAENLEAVVARLSGRRKRYVNPDKFRSWSRRSETPLFVKKRAKVLARVVRATLAFESLKGSDASETLTALVSSGSGRRALSTALQELKKARVGSSILDIIVCGAVPPYNVLLGGKLVAMLAASPQVARDYRMRYTAAASVIASSMKGAPVVRSPDLVFLATTSLYESHSSQYERIRIPTPNGEIRYTLLGKTEGFSSVQFSRRTQDLLRRVSSYRQGPRSENVFGAGVNPKLRQISRGLRDLGLADKAFQNYRNRRLVYGVPLASNAFPFLRGEAATPKYWWEGSSPDDARIEIRDHWLRRWGLPRFLRNGRSLLDSVSISEFKMQLHPEMQDQATLDHPNWSQRVKLAPVR